MGANTRNMELESPTCGGSTAKRGWGRKRGTRNLKSLHAWGKYCEAGKGAKTAPFFSDRIERPDPLPFVNDPFLPITDHRSPITHQQS